MCERKETKYSCVEDKIQELSLKLRSFIILTKAQISPHHPGTKPDNFKNINKHLSRQQIPMESTTQQKVARRSSPFSETLPWVGTKLLL